MGEKGENQYRPERRNTPSTGRGSQSALDAMIKRRAPVPGTRAQMPTPSPASKVRQPLPGLESTAPESWQSG
jgi:hypothetical protein